MDPQAEDSHAAVLLAFVNQAVPDIRRKLQKIVGLGEQTVQDLLKAAERYLIIGRSQKKGRNDFFGKKGNRN